MNMDLETKEFLACIECGKVVMRMQIHNNNKNKNKRTQLGSIDRSNHELMITLCHMCDPTDKIRGTFDDEGLVIKINKRMIETWYVYAALTKLVNGAIRVEDRVGKVQLVNRGEFIHTGKDTYELMTIEIYPDSPEDAIPAMCQHRTGFF